MDVTQITFQTKIYMMIKTVFLSIIALLCISCSNQNKGHFLNGKYLIEQMTTEAIATPGSFNYKGSFELENIYYLTISNFKSEDVDAINTFQIIYNDDDWEAKNIPNSISYEDNNLKITIPSDYSLIVNAESNYPRIEEKTYFVSIAMNNNEQTLYRFKVFEIANEEK